MKDLCTPDNRNVGFNITLDDLKNSLNEVTISEKIPENIHKMIELAKKTYLYSYYEYDFYALTTIYLSLLTETAIKERFLMELSDEIEMERKGQIKIIYKNYENVYGNLWKGWKIKEYPYINRSLRSIIEWIKNTDFLPERYKILDIDKIRYLRNSAAHLKDKDVYTPAIAQLFYCRTVDFINCLFDPVTYADEPEFFVQIHEFYQKVFNEIDKHNKTRD
ncbi:hypothetical protein ES705_06821 [subsurface metagenome]